MLKNGGGILIVEYIFPQLRNCVRQKEFYIFYVTHYKSTLQWVKYCN